ncbi:MAG: ABC transporter substrate-binding protein [Acidiferrobacterales bacterium]
MRFDRRTKCLIPRLVAVCMLALVGAQSAFALKLEIQPSRRLGEQAQSDKITQIRVAQQFGLAYLPLMIMRQFQLIENHAGRGGVSNIRVIWKRFPSGKVMNDALKAGLLDVAAGGVVPMMRRWDETRERNGVRGVAALSAMPLYLITRNPRVKTLADFTNEDRIALPAVKRSIQAVLLQMAAAQTFGEKNFQRLDKLTVSMAHPNAREALLAGKDNITAHFTSPPYQYQELKDPALHRVANSERILGGPATFTVLWTRPQFRDANPRTYFIFVEALKEAMAILKRDRRTNAEIYIQQANSGLSVDFVHEVLARPEMRFGIAPQNVMKYARFLYSTGQIKRLPEEWTEFFFPEIHGEPGS